MGRLLFSFKSSKAWVAGLVAAAGAFAVAMNDGTLSPMEVGNMVGAFLSGLGFGSRIVASGRIASSHL